MSAPVPLVLRRPCGNPRFHPVRGNEWTRARQMLARGGGLSERQIEEFFAAVTAARAKKR